MSKPPLAKKCLHCSRNGWLNVELTEPLPELLPVTIEMSGSSMTRRDPYPGEPPWSHLAFLRAKYAGANHAAIIVREEEADRLRVVGRIKTPLHKIIAQFTLEGEGATID